MEFATKMTQIPLLSYTIMSLNIPNQKTLLNINLPLSELLILF